MRPAPQPGEDDDVNSDNELVGIFDDDDDEPQLDESEDDDIDQDIVVSTSWCVHP